MDVVTELIGYGPVVCAALYPADTFAAYCGTPACCGEHAGVLVRLAR
ncbi:hypothetical protein G3A39_01910 [Paraburkholderia aspalathi]|nr:hypothetical protein [Paraburkholderia nemoris]MBK3737960.1 hypothetical protein [Paraburkholderia aspalathi]